MTKGAVSAFGRPPSLSINPQGAIRTGTDNYVNYLLPGILLIAIASGISYTAYRLFMQRGIFERFHSMPPAVRAFAENQPVTSIVDAIRALLSGQPVGHDIWTALAWCLGILIVAYIFAMRAYKRRA